MMLEIYLNIVFFIICDFSMCKSFLNNMFTPNNEIQKPSQDSSLKHHKCNALSPYSEAEFQIILFIHQAIITYHSN